jgi:acetyltransferase
MALGSLEKVRQTTLERSYRDVVSRLDDARRLLVVGEHGEAIVAMAQLAFGRETNADHRAEVQRVAVGVESRGGGVGRGLMSALEAAARERGVTLLWLTTHDGTDACRFYESVGYTKLGVMPDYSRRPDGTLWPGAFYFRRLAT